MTRTMPMLLVLLLVLSACAGGGGVPDDSDGPTASPSGSPGAGGGGGDEGDAIEHPTGADEAILVVEYTGGFGPVDLLATQLPAFVLLGDGRVIMQGMQTLEFPGPALPALIERRLTEAGIQEILAAVEETNLFTADAEFRGAMNVVADASDTVFTLHAAGLETTVTVYALGMLTPDMGELPGVTPGELQAHRVLQSLHDALMLLDDSLGADAYEDEGWRPYEPDGFRLFVRDVTGEPVEGGDLEDQVRQWPTDDDPTAFGEETSFGTGTRCGVVTGELGALWLTELSAANQATLWSDDGERRFAVSPRPLLPYEDPVCP